MSRLVGKTCVSFCNMAMDGEHLSFHIMWTCNSHQFAIVQVGKLPWCARTTMFHPRSISIVVSSKLQGIELRYLALVPRPESSYWHGASAWSWECEWVRLLVSDFLQGRLFLVVHAVMLQDYQTHGPLSCFETLQLCTWSEWVSSMTVSFDLYTVDVLRFILAICSSPFIEADAVLRRIFCPVVTPRTCRLPAKKINLLSNVEQFLWKPVVVEECSTISVKVIVCTQSLSLSSHWLRSGLHTCGCLQSDKRDNHKQYLARQWKNLGKEPGQQCSCSCWE